MAVDVPPILLQELLPPTYEAGQLIRLYHHNMPKAGVAEARTLDLKARTYPGGNHREIQAMGLTDADIELTGLLRDQWGGRGYASAARSALYALQRLANPVWLTWGSTWARMVMVKTVGITHQQQGLEYRLVLVPTELEEQPPQIVAQWDPGAGVRSLDDVGYALDDVDAISVPEAL